MEIERGTISLAERGRHAVDPHRERAARVAAFLQVPLYRALYERYRGFRLPPDIGLENEMAALGVSSKQVDKARQAFHRSAEQAGLFGQGKDRLVLPADMAGEPIGRHEEEHGPPQDRPATRSGGEGPKFPDLHPFIAGLLLTLPEPGSDWSEARRQQWLDTARNIFALIYEDGEERSVLEPEDVPLDHV